MWCCVLVEMDRTEGSQVFLNVTVNIILLSIGSILKSLVKAARYLR